MNQLVVFTDGACSGNGTVNAVGGIGIHFPNKELPDINKAYRIQGTCTNQRCELYAILIALKYIHSKLNLANYKVLIKSDSDYSINCITKWVSGWMKKGWRTSNNTPVLNRDLIEPIYQIYQQYNISFQHVAAHTKGTDFDSIANDVADRLACKARDRVAADKLKPIIRMID